MKQLYILLLIGVSASSQIINIPDPAFKNALVNTICVDVDYAWENPQPDADADLNNDGEIDMQEALAVQFLNVDLQSISSLEGLQHFVNLEGLFCSGNQISTLDVSMLPNMFQIRCDNNGMTTLTLNDFADLSGYYMLDCSDNDLQSLDLRGNAYMWVDCSNNPLTTLDISETLSIYEAYFYGLALTSFHIPDQFNCGELLLNAPLTEFTMAPTYFETLQISGTQLTSLDLGNIQGIANGLWILNNPNLQTLNLRNFYFDGEPGNNSITITGNPQLETVCVNDFSYTIDEGGDLVYVSELSAVTASVGPGVAVSPYCDFFPVGNHNTVNGNVIFDCGGANVPMQYIPVQNSINNDTSTDFNGEFTSYGYIGSYAVTPVIPNPDYFTITPAGFNINWTTLGNNEIVNFCITPNGNHPDVEISIITLVPPRPGFDAKYKIVCRNKGNQMASGIITLNFDDATADFISAAPGATSLGAGTVTWTLTDLPVFQKQEYLVVLNVNGPIEIPPVNGGDMMTITAAADIGFDANLDDNTVTNYSTVVNSFDPNDKTVTQGSQILTEQIDEYLHYVVRFQNTGTADAINVVVKDILESSLNAQTLQIISSSHPMQARRTGQKLEFIFEDINLPAESVDEPNSHGYISFKVKPAASVGLGSVIENTAEIYFDFNFPIVTNTVTTTVVPELGIGESHLNSVRMYPNPVKDQLHVASEQNIDAVDIYNTLGQLVRSHSCNGTDVDINVSNLSRGTYLIEVTNQKAKSILKLIKL